MSAVRLRDYKFYPATFEPCEVKGSKNGYKAIVHAQDMDIVTYGITYDNTIKMAQSVVTDMAHAMSLEEIIPGALSPSQLKVAKYHVKDGHSTHHPDNAPYDLKALAQMMADDVKSPDLAEPTYVHTLKQHDSEVMVAIELETQTALKIVIVNYLLEHKLKLSTLAERLGCKRAELEGQLDFYQNTNIYDLKLIIAQLDLKITDLDEILSA